MISASLRGHRQVVELLLAKGADVNAKDPTYGFTALMNAVNSNHPKIVRLLLDKGADVNAKTKYGVTVLEMASNRGHKEIQEMLIKAGAKKIWWEWMDRRESDAVNILCLFILGVGLIAFVGGGLWFWRTWQARGSEPDVGPQPDYLSSPPSDLPPAMVFLVRKPRLEKDDHAQLIMATLIDLVQKGFLEIEVEETPVIVGHHRRRDLLIRKGKSDPNYEFEKLVISNFAGHKLYGQAERVGLLLPEFKKSLERESVSMGFFEEEPTKAQMRVRKPGLVIFVTAFAAFVLMLFSGGLSTMEPKDWGVIFPLFWRWGL